MTGGLTQGDIDLVASETKAMYGDLLEEVTYTHKTTAHATPVVSTVTLHLAGYRKRDVDTGLINPTDLRGRIATADLPFTPTRFDSFVREDGTKWLVMYPEGGRQNPWWFLTCRQGG